jgi:hypothetical protein
MAKRSLAEILRSTWDIRSEFGKTAAEKADTKGGLVQKLVRGHART